MRFRKGTFDAGIFKSVYHSNEYGVGGFAGSDAIVDVGAHIGSFSKFVADTGAGLVLAFEPEKENFELMVENLLPEVVSGKVLAFMKGVMSAGSEKVEFRHSGYSDERGMKNTGGGNIFSKTGQLVDILPIGEVIKIAKRFSGRVRLIKLDCEGAEWPILFDEEADWDSVVEIVGEYHEWANAPFEIAGRRNLTAADLIERMRILGFEDLIERRVEGTNIGLFRGRRRRDASIVDFGTDDRQVVQEVGIAEQFSDDVQVHDR